ncbi:MAG: thiamine-phosphate kinase [Thaumarchaeota archaeon]|nr:thiamine-phosphate kinase [Nitrososphaerota archaeon]MCL5317743.1 thiamine-phosphate kinase [Nitrososphaerota archaeon]
MKLDEHEVIRIILETVGQPPSPYSNIGDDVAVLPRAEGDLVAKTDMLVRKTDVPKGMETWQMARKSIVACVSDFAAKGVQPQAALLSLALPATITRKEVKEMARGFKKARDEFGFNIVGGDTNEADDIVIDCCMLGFAERITERRGAAPGDRVVVTGPFGYQQVGLKVLQEGLEVPEEVRNLAVSSVLLPTPRLQLGIELTAEEWLSSSIDSSDGLALSLYQLADASEVGFEISRLPIDPELNEAAGKIGLDVDEAVLYGGEEYEIVATIPEDRLKWARRTAEKLGQRIIEIGKVTSETGQIVFSDDSRSFEIERRGWIHLAR